MCSPFWRRYLIENPTSTAEIINTFIDEQRTVSKINPSKSETLLVFQKNNRNMYSTMNAVYVNAVQHH